MLVHSGSAEGGHYYSYIKEWTSDKWFEFNDSSVKEFRASDLPKETFGGKNESSYGEYDVSWNAYLLVYERKSFLELEHVKIGEGRTDLINDIPWSVYQHIWDENVWFMKRTYYFDPDYLNFIKEFVYMYNFEWKLKISNEMTESKAM